METNYLTAETRKHRRRDLNAMADALRRAMTMRGYSQTQLADAIGVTQSQISTWVNGHYAPRPRHILAIEQELNLKLGSLSKFLGYVVVEDDYDPREKVETAITSDPLLDAEQTNALIALYRHYRSTTETL